MKEFRDIPTKRQMIEKVSELSGKVCEYESKLKGLEKSLKNYDAKTDEMEKTHKEHINKLED